MPDNRFCYRIEKEANLAVDTETGESAEAYTEINLGTDNVVIEGEEYNKLHNSAASGVASMLNINPEHVILISIEEYEENTD